MSTLNKLLRLHRRLRRYAPGVVLSTLMLAGAPEALGQRRPASQEDLERVVRQQTGADLSPEEIVERLRESGMSRSQVRSRLQQMGYDPGLADPYFDVIDTAGEPPSAPPSDRLLAAMRALGVLAVSDTLGPDSGAARDSIRRALPVDTVYTDSLGAGQLPVFGRDLFRGQTSQFLPLTHGPVGPDYQLGPGDELVLILTGDVETAYTLEVTREGFVVIPDVGQVYVNGVTLGQLEDQLYGRLGRVYSGVSRGADATTHFQLSLGRLRTNQVFVIGEAERPGAIQVDAIAGVLNALYITGGPKTTGSFRRIEVRRRGEVIRTVDLYDYLVNGDSRSDVRLENGDVIFVPIVGAQAEVQGAVRRPAKYELLPGDGLGALLRYAGGLNARALVSRIQIDRILPPAERSPGRERVLLDVGLDQLLNADREPIPVRDGDFVQVFNIANARRNRLTVVGEVNHPGIYEWSPGVTLADVIQRAQGLSEQAYVARAHVFRFNPVDSTRTLLQVSLLPGSPDAMPLADRDSIVVYSRATLGYADSIAVEGWVKEPKSYPFAQGITVRDLILAAGGFREGADTRVAEVARRSNPLVRSDTTAQLLRVGLEPGVSQAEAVGSPTLSAGEKVPVWVPAENEIELHPGDKVFVRRAPGYRGDFGEVVVVGEVGTPGNYALAQREERLLSILNRAGGLTSAAYAGGLQLRRAGLLIAADLPRALSTRSDRFNLSLQPNDTIRVPQYDPTVLVTGAVAFESRVPYVPGKGIEYYINRSGGYDTQADKGRTSVTFLNGERRTVEHRFLLPDGNPRPGPGSRIFVPARPPEDRAGINWDQLLSRTLSIIGTTVTIIIAARQL